MAVTSYEVGAIFKIVDAASPVLKALATQLTAIQGQVDKIKEAFSSIASTRLAGLTDRLGGVNTQLAKMGEGADKSAGAITAAFAKIDASAATTVASLATLKDEVGAIAIGAGASGAPAGIRRRAAGAHGGGAGGLGGFRGPALDLPGGSRFHMGGTAGMAGLGVLGYGAYQEAKIEDTIFQLLYHTGLANTPENQEKFRDIIQNAMSKTGMSLDSVGEAAKTEVRMFKGTPGGGVNVLPEMLSAAATEARLKGTSLEESMQALIGLAHMTKEYGPEQMKKLLPTFAFLSASNPSSLQSMERAASYAVPILQSGLEIDPETSLLLGTALTRAGATNTKSGTWLRNMALAAMPGTSLMSKVAFKKHEEALKALGLVDAEDKPTWFTDNKPDLIKMLEIAGQRAAGIPLEKRASYEKQLFGTQGFGGFALLADPAVRQQVTALKTEMNSPEFKNRYSTFLQDYNAQSPLQASRTAFADLSNVLADIGRVALPPVTLALRGLDDILQVIAHPLQSFADAITMLKNALGILGPAAPAISRPGMPMHPDSRPNSLVPMPADRHAELPMIHNKVAVYLNSAPISEAVSQDLAMISTFPRQAPYNDAYLGWNGPDSNAWA